MRALSTSVLAAIGAQLVGLSRLGSARILKDEIKQLPGWDAPLPSRHFSGYLAVPGDHGPKMYHCKSAEHDCTPWHHHQHAKGLALISCFPLCHNRLVRGKRE